MQLAETPRFGVPLERMLQVFDAAHYLRTHPDVAAALQAGQLASAEEHYRGWGYAESRSCFPLDDAWYGMQYPLAGFEVAQGDYMNFGQHYVATGRQRGYRPLPPDGFKMEYVPG